MFRSLCLGIARSVPLLFAVEVQVVNSFSSWTFQVVQLVDTQQVMVGEVVITFAVEESLSADNELSFKSNDGRHILMVLSQVVQEGDCALTVHCCLDAWVARVKSMLAKTKQKV